MLQVAAVAALAVALAASLSCDAAPSDDDDGPPPPVKDRRDLLARLGRPGHMLVGHGNDLPGAEKNYDFAQAGIYTLPVPLDIHYVYLTGIKGEQGWPDYEPDGGFVTHVATVDASKGVVPMFTLYQAAARGENRFDVFEDDDFMTKYWAGVRLLFQKLRAFDEPAIVHVEPDFWAYAQNASTNGDPSTVPVLVKSKMPECADLADDVGGLARCIVRMARILAPKVAIGLHASGFGPYGDAPKKVAKFLVAVGALDTDYVAIDTLDRDAGCFEARLDPQCDRNDGPPYWDASNTKPPTFEDHFAWVKTLHERLGLPVLWWQTPLGVPSDHPGGTPKHYRDNRVQYFFAHPEQLEQAGGFGMAYGVGAENQTDITTDGGQFARAVKGYYASPLPLLRP